MLILSLQGSAPKKANTAAVPDQVINDSHFKVNAELYSSKAKSVEHCCQKQLLV